MLAQNEQGATQPAFSPSDFASHQMGGVFLLSMCLGSSSHSSKGECVGIDQTP